MTRIARVRVQQENDLPSLLIHLGPHKTGSTAIRQALSLNRAVLGRHGVELLTGEDLDNAAMAVARGQYRRAKELLAKIATAASATGAERYVMSQEDFCGDIPVHGEVGAVYPKISKNLRVIARAFEAFDVSFVFFVRKEADWLQDCFSQNVRYRTPLTTFEEFKLSAGEAFSWGTVLAQARQQFGEQLALEPYSSKANTGFTQIMRRLGVAIDTSALQPASSESVFHPEEVNAGLERIGRFADIPSLSPLYKKRYLNRSNEHDAKLDPRWPPSMPERRVFGLERLAVRASKRIPSQPNVPDLLPDLDVDLRELGNSIMSDDTLFPTAAREDMNIQVLKLKHRFRGRSALAYTNALTISYLRRNTAHTAKAAKLFHRIWEEEGIVLVTELNSRWLISTLQTFLDHGKSEAQKLIGTAGYFYANMLKIYEGERAVEGRPPDAVYDNIEPTTAPAVRGLDRFSVGGTDLLLNTNALALELSQADRTAGIVLEEFLLRVKVSKTVFSRMDRTRAAKNVDAEGFKDAWSFFERPE